MDDDEVGYRFHPTEEQIISYYLEGKMQGKHFPNVIEEIDICKFEPWDLPERAALQSNDPVWYFFSEPDYKYANSSRINRRTTAGYWKPIGKDRPIRDKHGREIGIKKNLVFYRGRFNRGAKTNWVMHEYHSHNTSFYQKPFVLCRLKRKSDDGSNTCDGPSHQMASQVRKTMASQGNPRQPELESLPNESELDYNSLSELLSQMRPAAAHGSSYSTGSNYESNGWWSPTHINNSYTTEQEDEFVNSLRADQEGAYSFEETVNTHRLHGFNPPRSLRRVFAGDSSSYTDAETTYNSQWGNVQISMVHAPQSKKPRINCIRLVSEEFSVETRTSKTQHSQKSRNIENKSALGVKVSGKAVCRDEWGNVQISMVPAPQSKKPRINCIRLVSEEFPVETRTSKTQHSPKSQYIENKPALGVKVSGKAVCRDEWGNVQISMVPAPQLKKPHINCIRLVSEEFPVETRTSKTQHSKKSHNIENKSALGVKVSGKAVCRDELRDDVKLAIGLPRKENSILKDVKDRNIACSSGKTSWKMRSDESNGGRKGCIICLETSPLGHKPNLPSVYIGNILLAVVLFVFIITKMESLQ